MTAAITLPVAIDLVVAILLIVTIAYAVVLNRKLSVLRNAKADMEALLATFADSTAKAESGIQSLKSHASESSASLDTLNTRAQSLADDLTFLIEKGGTLAGRLEDAVGSARLKGGGAAPVTALSAVRGERGSGAAGTAAPSAKAAVEPEPSPEEAALLKSLRGVR